MKRIDGKISTVTANQEISVSIFGRFLTAGPSPDLSLMRLNKGPSEAP